MHPFINAEYYDACYRASVMSMKDGAKGLSWRDIHTI